MPKSKTPFFSLGARGTVGGVLTAQKRGGDTILRSTPVPTDPYSLNQAYQRWDYRDYAYLWTLLSNSQKQIYRTRGSRYHITGFSQWMRESLKAKTGIVARWRLDEKSGAIAYDSGPNAINATIFGASPTDGVIDGAYSQDGLNDWIDCTTNPLLGDLTEFTIEGYCYLPAHVVNAGIVADVPYTDEAHMAFNIRDLIPPANALLAISDGTIAQYWQPFMFPLNAWTYFAYGLKAGDILIAVCNEDYYTTPTALTRLNARTHNLAIGAYAGGFTEGLFDHVTFYSRLIDQTEALRHSRRRYPA